ncbi:MAG: hypothetical protein GY950_35285 [bacterium]|nr:hypothetical protein [bacterium]
MMGDKVKIIVFLLLLPVLAVMVVGQDVSDTNFSGVVGAGARAFGMGGAFIAVADDATAASWNPAGLGQLERPEVTFVLRYQNYRDMEPANGDGLTYFLGPEDMLASSYGFDFLSFSFPFRIGNFKLVPQVSYQRAINYDLEFISNDVRYFFSEVHPNLEIPVRVNGDVSETQTYKGGLDVLSLSLGSRLLDWLCVGVSANVWLNGYEGRSEYNFPGEFSALDGSGLQGSWNRYYMESLNVHIRGLNFNFGVLVDVTEKFKVGAVYKSSFYTNTEYSLSVARELSFGDSGGKAFKLEETEIGKSSLRWPKTFGVGFSYRPIDPLTISMDFTQTRWSQAVLEDFPRHDEEAGITGKTDFYFPTFVEVDNEYGFKQLDTRQFRVGLEYVLIGKKTLIPLRAGFFIDSQYYPDASDTQVHLFGFTAGFGIKWGGFCIDFAALLETGRYLADNMDYAATGFTEVRAYMSTSYSF